MQGRGWGYDARGDQYCAGHILFWGYGFDNVEKQTDIYFNHNYVYNPRRLYYIASHDGIDILFQEKNCIRSDYNHYYMNNDTFIFNDEYNFDTRKDFIQEFNKNNNSEFILLEKVDPNLEDKIANSLNYKELRKIFVDDVDDVDDVDVVDDEKENESHALKIILIVIVIIILALVGGIFIFCCVKKNKSEISIDKVNNNPLVE